MEWKFLGAKVLNSKSSLPGQLGTFTRGSEKAWEWKISNSVFYSDNRHQNLPKYITGYTSVNSSLPSRFYPCGTSDARVLAIIVCLCVCLSHVGIGSKQLNVGSHKQDHTSFLTPKVIGNLVDDPPSPEICAQSDPPRFKNHNLD